MTLLRLAPVAALFAMTGCGAGQTEDEGPREDAGAGEPTPTVYQGALTVLENEEHGPQLAGVTTMSLPPQGGGMDVTGWDWASVEHEEAAGTRWGMYLVTGTFDGESFALTEDPLPADEIDMSDYPHLEQGPAESPEPSQRLEEAELQTIADELAERFPEVVTGARADAESGVAWVDATLVTPELEAFAHETYPEGTVAFTAMLHPIS